MSIYKNVCLGLLETPFENARPWIQQCIVVEACRSAGISDIIDAFPRKYNTPVGPKSTLLSGGQRHCLAFAQAIIHSPRVLILDKPTSALDQESQNIIQDALEMISVDWAVIVIVHRLSTIRKADSIVVINGGKVAKHCTHKGFLQHKGAYFLLPQARRSSAGLRCENKSLSIREKRLTSRTETSRWSSDTMDGQEDQLDILKAKEMKHGIIHHLIQIEKFNRPEKYLMILGFIAAIACGAVYPVQAFYIAKMIVLSTTHTDPSFSSSANHFSLAFLIIAGVKCISHFTSTFTLGVCCKKMVSRVRSQTFRSILQKNIEWFHDSEHSAADLVFCLSQLCTDLKGLHSFSLAMFIEIGTNLISAAVFSLVVAWEYALVIIPAVPIIALAGYLQCLILRIFQNAITEWHNQSAILACKAISSIRTVAALTREAAYAELSECFGEGVEVGCLLDLEIVCFIFSG
jgi:ATP-binding cassette, subfamily B (MDR/TAP), member 1